MIKLEHNQFISINRNAAVELRITLEAEGTEHKNRIVQALNDADTAPSLSNPRACTVTDSAVRKNGGIWDERGC